MWAWQKGAYFGTTLLPGTAVLCVVAALLILFRPAVTIRRPTLVAAALVALAGLGAWALLSAIWSPAPDVAIADGQRILTYAVIFGLAAWAGILLAGRSHLAMVPAVVAGLVAGAITVVTIIHGNELQSYLSIGTLDFPLGYRNANAAFFLIVVWPAVGLAANGAVDWRLRALSLGVATLCLELAMLSQSRASLIAGPLALAVFLVASRDRAPALLWLSLAALPALLVVDPLVDLFHAADHDSRPVVVEALHDAGRAALLGSLIAVALGAVAALVARRFPISAGSLRTANRATAVLLVLGVLAGAVAFTAATDDPFGWIGDKVKEFRTQNTPDFSREGSRFSGLKTGSSRYAIWRIAADDLTDHPLLGDGGGGFHYSYLRVNDGDGPRTVRDAHSVELEVASEFGFPGLVMLIAAVGAMAAGAIRLRLRGGDATGLATVALAAGTYWLAHSSVDWFWPYPAVTGTAFALLGAACGAATLWRSDSGPREGRRAGGMRVARWASVAALVVLTVSLVPPYLSDRYVNDAYDVWQSDLGRAYRDLDRAASLNPLSDEPALVKGVIARAAGERATAIAAFRDAARQRPEEWAAHYFLALLYADRDRETALEQLRKAEQLNPFERRIDDLRERIRGA